MNTMVIKTFQRLLLRQKHNYKKEVLAGFLFLGIAIWAYLLDQAVANLLVLTYLLVSSTANFTKNDVFWNADDFKSLNISMNTPQYFIFYVIQRILLDTWLSNLILGTGLLVFFLWKFGALQGITFVAFLVWYFAISPACSIIYSKKNKTITAICIALLVLIPLLLWMDFIFWKQFSDIYILRNAIDCISCLVFIVATYVFFAEIGRVCKAKKTSTYWPRIILSFLKKIDPWVYKDYLLNDKMIFTNLLSLVVTLALFSNPDDMEILKPFLLWLVCSNKVFFKKDKTTKKQMLQLKDPLFCKQIEEEDYIFVRKKKFKTVISGGIVKFLVAVPFLIMLGYVLLENILIFVSASLISSTLECFDIFKNRRSTQVIVYLLKTTIPIVWGCLILNDYPMLFLYVYLTVFALISILLLWGITGKDKISYGVTVI